MADEAARILELLSQVAELTTKVANLQHQRDALDQRMRKLEQDLEIAIRMSDTCKLRIREQNALITEVEETAAKYLLRARTAEAELRDLAK